MIEWLATSVVDESRWLAFSLAIAVLATVTVVIRRRDPRLEMRRRVLAAMNLFFGVTIGTMAFGHLLAVTVKLGMGTLADRLLIYYAIGVALAVPSWWLIVHTVRVLAPDREHGTGTMVLNLSTAGVLLALGLHNLPLAAPGLLNVGYHLHTRRRVGWAIVGLAATVALLLFVGSLVFLASGQSFEQFRGM